MYFTKVTARDNIAGVPINPDEIGRTVPVMEDILGRSLQATSYQVHVILMAGRAWQSRPDSRGSSAYIQRCQDQLIAGFTHRPNKDSVALAFALNRRPGSASLHIELTLQTTAHNQFYLENTILFEILSKFGFRNGFTTYCDHLGAHLTQSEIRVDERYFTNDHGVRIFVDDSDLGPRVSVDNRRLRTYGSGILTGPAHPAGSYLRLIVTDASGYPAFGEARTTLRQYTEKLASSFNAHVHC